jgi:hypothetical protein
LSYNFPAGYAYDTCRIWIEFRDPPMVSVDGIYIKRMLQFREDLSEEMENVVVRVLRNDEADKRAEIDGNVHYVMHMWAVSNIILLYNPH